MAAKKKAKKKQTKSEQATRRKLTAMKKTGKKKPAVKGQTPKKQSANNSAHKKEAFRAVGRRVKSRRGSPVRGRSRTDEAGTSSRMEAAARGGGQSGDLQGLSNVETADSESVEELLEEGNAFEAGVVSGVEDAGRTDRSEVHTHEVLEDDVPEEYLDGE